MGLLLIVRYPEEGPGLLRWAQRAADAVAKPLEVVVCDPEADREIEWADEDTPAPDYLAGSYARWGRVRLSAALGQVSQHVLDNDTELVLLGKHNSGKADGNTSPERRFARAAFEHLPCAVCVLRLPKTERDAPGKTLVPAAGGRNSRVALKVASGFAGADTTAFFLEPNVDEVSADVGERRLLKAVKKAGLDPEEIERKVALGEDLAAEIRKEAESGDYDLILIGASSSKTLRSKLFGTLPDRLLRGPAGLAIGVIRAKPRPGRKLKDAAGRLLRLSVPQLEREERIGLVEEVEGKSRWTFDFAMLMALATAIAAFGLVADSVAVVIGAMLVAPLMTPLIGGGLALVQGNWPLWRRSARAVLMGFFLALVIGGIVGLAARFLGFGLTNELAARGAPTLLDLGVAFASGIAASYCLARPHLTGALAGVAIAAALVPPIATVGICLALGETVTARGAALLFGTNVVAIVLGAAANFFAAGIRGRSGASGLWSRRLFISLMLVCAALTIPLTSILVGKVTAPRILEQGISRVAEEEGYRLVKLRRFQRDGEAVLDLELAGPKPPSPELMEKLRTTAAKKTGRPIGLRIRTLLESELTGSE